MYGVDLGVLQKREERKEVAITTTSGHRDVGVGVDVVVVVHDMVYEFGHVTKI